MSYSASDVLSALAYAGVGVGLGTVGAALIVARSGKGEARAHAADMLATGYSGFTDRLAKDNERLVAENLKLRSLLLELGYAVDATLDSKGRPSAQVLADLRNKLIEAKRL